MTSNTHTQKYANIKFGFLVLILLKLHFYNNLNQIGTLIKTLKNSPNLNVTFSLFFCLNNDVPYFFLGIGYIAINASDFQN